MNIDSSNFLKSTAVAVVSALLASTPAFAASITNGNFETNTLATPVETAVTNGQTGFVYLPTGSTAITGFTVIAGNQGGGVSYLGRTVFSNNGAVSRTVQLNGQNSQGGISTTLTGLTTGQNVFVQFDLSGNIDFATAPRVSVDINGGTSQTFSLAGNGGLPSFNAGAPGIAANLLFQTFTAQFVYTGTAPTAALNFLSQSGTTIGPIIDNIVVSPTRVPFEFSPVSGFVAGGILFGAYKMINRKKSIA